MRVLSSPLCRRHTFLSKTPAWFYHGFVALVTRSWMVLFSNPADVILHVLLWNQESPGGASIHVSVKTRNTVVVVSKGLIHVTPSRPGIGTLSAGHRP